MKRLVYFKPSTLIAQASPEMPGTELAAKYARIYRAGAIPVDRTSTITTPFSMQVVHPLPVFRPFTVSFGDICAARAREILSRADALDVRIYCLWSGGIDSTLALISLLQNASLQQKKRLCVLISADSIEENRVFFYDHIHTRIEVGMSTSAPFLIGGRDILVSGECNDQLFGSDAFGTFINAFGPSVIHEPFNRNHVRTVYDTLLQDETVAEFYIRLFERLLTASPIPLTTTFDYLWWINFTLKWQTTCYRMLTFAAPYNQNLVTALYVHERYFPFYNTEDFQLWSLNNHDKKIKNDWKSYKWPCKDLIYDYTKDAEYRNNKTKRGSLSTFVRYQESFKRLDPDFTVHSEIVLRDYYVPHNDFVV